MIAVAMKYSRAASPHGLSMGLLTKLLIEYSTALFVWDSGLLNAGNVTNT